MREDKISKFAIDGRYFLEYVVSKLGIRQPRDEACAQAGLVETNHGSSSLRQHRHHCHRHHNASVAASTASAHLINDHDDLLQHPLTTHTTANMVSDSW